MSELIESQVKEKKGGPYSAKERRLRRERVAEYHFDKGIPAVEISRMLDVNRNTVSNDLRYCYSKLREEYSIFDVTTRYMGQTHRMEIQRRRLVDLLGKQISFKERLMLERLITDIDNKIMQSALRLFTSREYVNRLALIMFNLWAKNQQPSFKGIRGKDLTRISTKAKEKIDEIIDEDWEKNHCFDPLN